MDHLHVRTVPQGGGDLLGARPGFSPRRRLRNCSGPGQLRGLRVDDRDQVSLVERAADLLNADGQQAAALLLDRPAGAVVDREPAAGLRGEADPPLPGAERLPLGDEERADQLATCDPLQVAGLPAAGDDHVFAGRGRDPRCPILLAIPPLLSPVARSQTMAWMEASSR